MSNSVYKGKTLLRMNIDDVELALDDISMYPRAEGKLMLSLNEGHGSVAMYIITPDEVRDLARRLLAAVGE